MMDGPNGLVAIDKPADITSHDVVAAARRIFRVRRIGHTGTLDPAATGLLVLCIGQATRLAEYISVSRKSYQAGVLLGVTTDTHDMTGRVTAEESAADVSLERIEEALTAFRGTIRQVPPMVSAIHYHGQRLYELARKGLNVDRAPRDVEVFHLEMDDFKPGRRALVTLTVTCSKGAYIRSLAADIGAVLGCGATLQSLRRTWMGDETGMGFSIDEAYTLAELERKAADGALGSALLPSVRAVMGLPRIVVPDDLVPLVRHGRPISLEELAAVDRRWTPHQLVALLSDRNEILAVMSQHLGTLKPVKVLAS